MKRPLTSTLKSVTNPEYTPFHKKQAALSFFLEKLLSGEAGSSIAKVILFGSLARKEARPESDIDLYVVAVNKLEEVSLACYEASLDTTLQFDEGVEPVVGCIDEFRSHTASYFLRKVLKDHEEVYTMTGEEISRGEAANFLALAIEYLSQSRSNLTLGNYRLLVDGAYNAAELCAKGLLILKGEDIPRKHGNIIRLFSRLYIKSNELPRELGRELNRGLRFRNQARYEYHSALTERDALAILDLAEKMVKALEDLLIEK